MREIFYEVLGNACYAAICSVVIFWAGLFMPRKLFNPDNFWFSERKWENGGRAYNKVGVSKWKGMLPDMSKYANRLLLKRLSGGETAADIAALIVETCVAETAHFLLAALSVGMIIMSRDLTGVLCAVLYAFGNMPYIIIQRYNRPRLKKMLERMERRGIRHTAETAAAGGI